MGESFKPNCRTMTKSFAYGSESQMNHFLYPRDQYRLFLTSRPNFADGAAVIASQEQEYDKVSTRFEPDTTVRWYESAEKTPSMSQTIRCIPGHAPCEMTTLKSYISIFFLLRILHR